MYIEDGLVKLIVVGGHSRGVGKTSVTAGIIAATRDLGWTAVKITQHGHGIQAHNEHTGSAAGNPDAPYSLTKETTAGSDSDTCRYLAAGAIDAYWLRTPYGRLAAALPALDSLFARCGYVIVESNSILDYRTPDLYLPVLDFSNPDCKNSCRTHLPRAAAFITVNHNGAPPPWSGVDPALFTTRPLFPVRPPSYFHPAIAAFVRSYTR